MTQHVQAVDIPVVDHMQTACPVTDGQDEEDRRESEKNGRRHQACPLS
jgi:hypothetical protein